MRSGFGGRGRFRTCPGNRDAQQYVDVRRFFENMAGLIVFDVEADPISDLVTFLAPTFELAPEHWRKEHATP